MIKLIQNIKLNYVEHLYIKDIVGLVIVVILFINLMIVINLWLIVIVIFIRIGKCFIKIALNQKLDICFNDIYIIIEIKYYDIMLLLFNWPSIGILAPYP